MWLLPMAKMEEEEEEEKGIYNKVHTVPLVLLLFLTRKAGPVVCSLVSEVNRGRSLRISACWGTEVSSGWAFCSCRCRHAQNEGLYPNLHLYLWSHSCKVWCEMNIYTKCSFFDSFLAFLECGDSLWIFAAVFKLRVLCCLLLEGPWPQEFPHHVARSCKGCTLCLHSCKVSS